MSLAGEIFPGGPWEHDVHQSNVIVHAKEEVFFAENFLRLSLIRNLECAVGDSEMLIGVFHHDRVGRTAVAQLEVFVEEHREGHFDWKVAYLSAVFRKSSRQLWIRQNIVD